MYEDCLILCTQWYIYPVLHSAVGAISVMLSTLTLLQTRLNLDVNLSKYMSELSGDEEIKRNVAVLMGEEDLRNCSRVIGKSS